MSSQLQPVSAAQSAAGIGDAAGSTLSTKVLLPPPPLLPPILHATRVARLILCPAHTRARRDRFCPCASCSAIRRRFDPPLFLRTPDKNLVPTLQLSQAATSPLPVALGQRSEHCPCPAAAHSVASTRTYKYCPLILPQFLHLLPSHIVTRLQAHCDRLLAASIRYQGTARFRLGHSLHSQPQTCDIFLLAQVSSAGPRPAPNLAAPRGRCRKERRCQGNSLLAAPHTPFHIDSHC